MRELRATPLGIKTASAFVVRAPAGQIRLDPATASYGEAGWIYYLRGTIYYLFGKGGFGLTIFDLFDFAEATEDRAGWVLS